MRFIYILLAVIGMMQTSGCGEDEQVLTPNEVTEEHLTSQIWEMTEVKIDDVVSDLYAGLTLSFGSKTYTTIHGGKVWPASGSWEFVGDKGDKILRDDGLQITIESANASQLVMSFTWSSTTFDGGRVGSLTGMHRMTFKRKT